MEIIVSHNNTDLDGLASMIAAQKLYPEAKLVYAGKLQRNVREFMALHKDTFNIVLAKDIPFKDVTRLILVDNKNASRIGDAKAVLDNDNIEIFIFDHHPNSEDDIRGKLEVVEHIGSTTTLLVELIREKGLEISSLEATVFAMGIYEDTGSLTFSTTTARDAEAVAYLLEKGAKLAVVAEFIDRPLSDRQKSLLNSLIFASDTTDISGVKVLITSGKTDEYIDGLALLVHKIIDISNIDAAIAAVYMEDRIHIVARSRHESVNVAKILEKYNGGGHSSAASATVRSGSVEKIIKEIKSLLNENICPEIIAEQLMSSPVKMITQDKTIDEAAKILLRYGHTGLPVVDGEKLVGIISRRDIDKAKHHGLGHAPVKGFMSRKVITINKKTTLPEIQNIMIENNIGRLPVIENELIVGIISRTDVLRTLHGENYAGRYEKVYSITQPITCVGENVTDLMLKNLPAKIRDLLGQISYLADKEDYKVYIVGGFVRDLILGVSNLDIDLVVEGDAPAFARRLAEFACGRVKFHEKFATAMVILPDNFRIDVATARTEYYEYPAALPKVEVSSLKQDLYRRDFTINAMAITLSEKKFGGVVDYFGGRKDLDEGIIRVLYNLSFVEDPTRILRAIRFEQRYGFKIEQQTLSLAKNAIKEKLLLKLSADRIREELKHIFNELSPVGAVLRMKELNVLSQVIPEAEVNPAAIEAMKRVPGAIDYIKELVNNNIHTWIVYLAILLSKKGCQAVTAGEHLRITKQEQKILTEILCRCSEIIEILSLNKPMKMSEIAAEFRNLPVEGYVFIMAMSPNGIVLERLKNYLARSRHNKLQVNGEDIKCMGFKPGVLFQKALDAARDAKLDGLITTKEDELRYISNYLNKLQEQKGDK